MRWHSKWLFLGGCVLAATIASHARRLEASQYFDDQRGEYTARIGTQNTFQHNDINSIDWVQWRNELRFDLKYDLIEQGKGESWGPLKAVKFNMLYRARITGAA